MIVKKRNKAGRLLVFFIFFLAGNIFFLSSKVLFGTTYKGVPVQPLGEAVSSDNRVITVYDWAYDPHSKDMRILLEINDYSLSPDTQYAFSVFSQEKGYKTDIVYHLGSVYAVRVSKVNKDYKELALNISAEGFEGIKLYTNDKVVSEEAELFDYEDYSQLLLSKKTVLLEKKAESIFSEMESIKENISASEKKIEELTERKEKAFEDEKAEIESNITRITQSLANYRTEYDKKEKEYSEALMILKEYKNE